MSAKKVERQPTKDIRLVSSVWFEVIKEYTEIKKRNELMDDENDENKSGTEGKVMKKNVNNVIIRFVYFVRSFVKKMQKREDGKIQKVKIPTKIIKKELSTVTGYVSPFDPNIRFESVDELLSFLSARYKAFIFKKRNEKINDDGQIVFTIITASSGQSTGLGSNPEAIDSIDKAALNHKYLNGFHASYGTHHFEKRNDYDLECGLEGDVMVNNLSPYYEHTAQKINDFLDNAEKESEFMIIWNRFIIDFRRDRIGRDIRMRLLEGFIKHFGSVLKDHGLRTHMAIMIDQLMRSDEDITPDDVMNLVTKLTDL